MKRIRRILAQWLYPEVFQECWQWQFEYMRVSDAYWWLGEFPEATATLRWILDHHQDWTRPVGEPLPERKHYWRSDIGSFREQLRRGEHLLAYGRKEPSAVPPRHVAEEGA